MVFNNGTSFGDAGAATTLIMTDMHTTTTATISMDVIKLTVNGILPAETAEEIFVPNITSLFDIYPDTIANNAIVIGYAEETKALGDQTPITYPYTTHISVARDKKGRYNASDLGLVPITVTTGEELDASGATEAA